jgi:hypothetical protein
MTRTPSFNRLLASTPGRIAMQVGAFAIEVALERRRITRGSPRRARRVDARTGADPSLRQTIVLLGAPRATQQLIRVLTPGSNAKLQAQHHELQDELRRLQAEHADDPQARQEAIMRFQRTRDPVRVSCLPVLTRLVLGIAVNRCPVPFISARRTLPDLLAGTRVVRDDPPRHLRLGGRWLRGGR